jgi:hypothetical protein
MVYCFKGKEGIKEEEMEENKELRHKYSLYRNSHLFPFEFSFSVDESVLTLDVCPQNDRLHTTGLN